MSLRDKDNDRLRCWDRTEGIESLRVEMEDGDIYTFPYIHLSHTRLTRNADEHILDISFSSHLITIKGHFLQELSLALQKTSIDWIRTAKDHAQHSEKIAIIHSIKIEEEEEI